jgi:tripartite-type tricarboxylate transporter receptor subunit TctC
MPLARTAAMTTAVALAIAVIPAAAVSQTFPDRPIKLLIGFTAGSSADVSARIVAEEMGKPLGQPVMVEARPGASSNIAAQAVAKADPDGYTLFYASVANVLSFTTKQAASVDLGKELKAVGLVCAVPNILVVNPQVKATSVKELIALAKAEPGKLNYGSPGPGTIPHLSGELFNVMAGVKMVHVPYKGTPQAAQDVVGGSLQLMFAPSSTVLGLIEGKQLRALAWTITRRGPALPDLPTVSEAGLPGFDTSIWFGISAPPATPDAVRDRLAAALATALKSDSVGKAFRTQGIEPFPGGPAEFARYIGTETTKWSDIAVKAGLVK